MPESFVMCEIVVELETVIVKQMFIPLEGVLVSGTRRKYVWSLVLSRRH